MFNSFIFDASKGQTPEGLARQRALAAQIMGQIGNRPARNVGEGVGNALASIGHGISANVMNRRANAAETEGREGANSLFDSIVGGITNGTPIPPSPSGFLGGVPVGGGEQLDPASARVAQAHGDYDSALPSSFLSAVDRTEGAGGYDTLYGHAQRSGPFAGTDVSSMTVGDALAFSAPSGAYGQHVKGQIGRVATPMGRHQIVGSTLRRAVNDLGIDPSTPFNAQTQDQIAAHLARQRISGANTMQGKISALRSEWHGFNNVPDAQMVQIVNDLETMPRGQTPAVAATEAMATGQMPPQMNAFAGPEATSLSGRQVNADMPMAGAGGFGPMDQQPMQMAQAGGMPTQQGGPDLQALMQAASNPWLNEGQRAVINTMLQQALQQQDPSHQLDMEYRQAQIEKMQRDAQGGDTRYGLNPIYGQDDEGNTVLGVLGTDGSFKPVDTGGVNLSSGVDRVDLGTHYGLLDKRSGQMVGTLPKENREAARDTAIGKIEGETLGEASVNLGTTLQKADQSIALIDQMLNHPGLPTATGLSGVLDPRNYVYGSDATNFNVMRKQLEGKAFLEAFESLKGGGQITEIEGQKATEAIARLSTTQSEDAYREALGELRDILETGKQRAAQRAGQSFPDVAPQTPSGQPRRLRFNPETGELE